MNDKFNQSPSVNLSECFIVSKTRSKNINRSSSLTTSLIERYNERILKSQLDKMKQHNSLISQNNLNTLLCKLKDYYNEVLTLTQEKQKEINSLSKNNQTLVIKCKEATDFQPIDLPEEKISLRNFNGLKVTKEQLDSKLRYVLLDRKDLVEVFKKEEEYFKTLEYMYQKERDNLKQINDSIAETEARLHTLSAFQKNIDRNLNEQNKKRSHYDEIITRLNDDIDIIDNICVDQSQKTNEFNSNITNQEEIINDMRLELIDNQKNKEDYVRQEKKNIRERIEMVNDVMKNKHNKEQSYIRTILCLSLIQKHFLNVSEFNLNMLLKSKEYQDLSNDNVVIYTIKDNDEEDKDKDNNCKGKEKEIAFKSSSIYDEKHDSKNRHNKMSNSNKNSNTNLNHPAFNKTMIMQKHSSRNKHSKQFSSSQTVNMNMNRTQQIKATNLKPGLSGKIIIGKNVTRFTQLNKQAMISLQELKKQFDELQITRDDLFEYHYQIANKITFLRNTLSYYNHKQIHYENKKNVYYAKVKEIINKDYWNFRLLVTNNSRLKQFLNKNEVMISESKIRHEDSKINHIYKEYYLYDTNILHPDLCLSSKKQLEKDGYDNNEANCNSNDNRNDDNRSVVIAEQKKRTINSIKTKATEVFDTSHHLLREIKNFFDGIHAIISVHKTNLIQESYKKFKVIEKAMNQLSSYHLIPFEEYSTLLTDYIIKTDGNEEKVDAICGENTIEKLKQELFHEGNTDRPRSDYIKKFIEKNINNQSTIFSFLNDKRIIVKGLKSAFNFTLQLKVVDDSAPLAQALSSLKKKESLKDPLNYNKFLHSFKKGVIKPKVPRQVNDTVIKDDDSYSEKETTQTDNKNTKRRNNSMDDRVIKKLYKPFLEKTFYNRTLNDNMAVIKNMTRSFSKDNFALIRKKNEINKISNSLLIYNNPSKPILSHLYNCSSIEINVNDLSNSTYNTIVKYIVSNQINNNKGWKTKPIA